MQALHQMCKFTSGIIKQIAAAWTTPVTTPNNCKTMLCLQNKRTLHLFIDVFIILNNVMKWSKSKLLSIFVVFPLVMDYGTAECIRIREHEMSILRKTKKTMITAIHGVQLTETRTSLEL